MGFLPLRNEDERAINHLRHEWIYENYQMNETEDEPRFLFRVRLRSEAVTMFPNSTVRFFFLSSSGNKLKFFRADDSVHFVTKCFLWNEIYTYVVWILYYAIDRLHLPLVWGLPLWGVLVVGVRGRFLGCCWGTVGDRYSHSWIWFYDSWLNEDIYVLMDWIILCVTVYHLRETVYGDTNKERNEVELNYLFFLYV